MGAREIFVMCELLVAGILASDMGVKSSTKHHVNGIAVIAKYHKTSCEQHAKVSGQVQ